jgi:hypothetical protein
MKTLLKQISNPRDAAATAGSLNVQVVATSASGTRAALQAAQAMAAGLDARIVVVVPQVVHYHESLEHPTVSPDFVGNRFRTVAEALAMDVEVRVCVCRSQTTALASALPRDAVVLVGGKTRRWWPTAEQRLTAALVSRGCRALLIVA